jgi:hypothetical protein
MTTIIAKKGGFIGKKTLSANHRKTEPTPEQALRTKGAGLREKGGVFCQKGGGL